MRGQQELRGALISRERTTTMFLLFLALCFCSNERAQLVVAPRFSGINLGEGLLLGTDVVSNIFGYFDMNGNCVIDLGKKNIRVAWPFTEGLALIKKNGKYGFIDKRGEIVIPPTFDAALPFSEGLAAVRKGAKWGYIDKTGKLVAKPLFNNAASFSEGLASVNIAGEVEACAVIGEDTIAYFTRGGKNCYVDRTGVIVIRTDYDYVFPFENGFAMVCKGGKVGRWGITGGKWGLIDKRGRLAVEAIYEDVNNFREGYARVRLQERYGFVDRSGNYLVEPMFGNACDFSEGLAFVIHNGLCGYIDTTGRFAIKPQFLSAGDFSEGLAPAAKEDKWGFIDKSGQFKIEQRFYDAEHFSEGFAVVHYSTSGGLHKLAFGHKCKFREHSAGFREITKKSYIDKKGNLIIDKKFDDAGRFNDGLACVRVGDKWGLIGVVRRKK